MLRRERERRAELQFSRYCSLDIFDQPDPPDPNPGIIANAQASERVGLEAVDLGRQQFAYSKERNANLDALAQRVIDQQLAIGADTLAQGKEFADYYRNTYRPLEQQIVQAAQNYDVEGTMVNRAIADTRSVFANQRGQLTRQQAAYGTAPNAALMTDLGIGEAAATAGNANRARQSAIAQKTGMLLDAAALGQGKPMNSTANYGLSLNAGNSAIGNQAAINSAQLSNTQSALPWYGTGASAFGNAGQLYNADYSGRLNAYNSQMNAYGSGMGGLGQLAGQLGSSYLGYLAFAADGGEVDGPGGPRDDAIPAQLSDGEYVIPADVVKAKGTEYFDRLLEKYHQDGQKQAPPPADKTYRPRLAIPQAAHGGAIDRKHMTRARPLAAIAHMAGGY